MNQMEIFKNPEFGSIRTFEQDDKVLFCGKDIAKALGYQRTADAITAHCRTSCRWRSSSVRLPTMNWNVA